MKLTFDTLFSDPLIVKAVIDRTQAVQKDPIFWQRYLRFEETKSRTFKTYFGTQTGVRMGSIIGKDSKKPLRARTSVGSGYGEVAPLGDKYQLDNDRLDMIRQLIDKFNAQNNLENINAIVDFIFDDYRQVALAPHKRMDKIVGDLRSTGKASVKVADNPRGIELIDITLPVVEHEIPVAQKASLITYLQSYIQGKKATMGTFSVMEMNQKTFNTKVKASDEFKTMYTQILGSSELLIGGGILTEKMANELLTGIGLPPIRIVEEYVEKPDGTSVNTFADDRISLLQSDALGKMKWHQPYEATDPVPGKAYTTLAGGQFISTQRTEEGRFIEYGCEWIPDFSAPNKILILDTSKLV